MRILKHKNNTDIALEVIDEMMTDPEHVDIFGHWWNIANIPPFPMYAGGYSYIRPIKQWVKIKVKDFSNWEEFDSPQDARAAVKWGQVKDLG